MVFWAVGVFAGSAGVLFLVILTIKTRRRVSPNKSGKRSNDFRVRLSLTKVENSKSYMCNMI